MAFFGVGQQSLQPSGGLRSSSRAGDTRMPRYKEWREEYVERPVEEMKVPPSEVPSAAPMMLLFCR